MHFLASDSLNAYLCYVDKKSQLEFKHKPKMWQEEMQIEQIDQAGVTQASLTKLELKVHKNHNLVLVLVGF